MWTPLNFANLKEGETVVDLGSGAGIDAFLASKQVKDTGKVIGIDFTDDMLESYRLLMNMDLKMLNLGKEI